VASSAQGVTSARVFLNMKKTLALTLVLGAVVAPGALAAKGPKPRTDDQQAAQTTVVCKAPRAAVLVGTFVAAGDGSFTMDVSKANAHGRKLAGKHGFAVKVDAKTRFVRGGAAAALADLKAGDRLNVQASLCKGADAERTELLARRVVAKAAKTPDAETESSSS